MRHVFIAAAGTVLLAGCSAFDAQRPIGNAFSPPAGWSEVSIPVKVAANPILGMWTHGVSEKGARGDFIMLMRFPVTSDKPIDETAFAKSAGAKDATVTQRKDVTLCDGAKGVKLNMTATQVSSAGKQLSMETMLGQGKGEMLIAIYAHDVHSPPDPKAVAAVEHLCPILK